MKQSKYSDAQIMHCPAAHVYMCERGILKQSENGAPVADLYREHGMSSASFYKWRSKNGGMDASLVVRNRWLFCFRWCTEPYAARSRGTRGRAQPSQVWSAQ